jgi:hypothetical protein
MEDDTLHREELARRPPISAKSDARLADEERLAEEVYDRLILPALRPEDDGKYVAIAFEANDFEIDSDDYIATDRLLARHPGARLWLMRAGWQAAYRLRGLAGSRS